MPITFRDNDPGYERWIASHPDGLVVNTYRSPTPSYLRLHRATCRTISGTPAWGDQWTSGAYVKVCATDRVTLDRWADETVGGALVPCPLCQP